MEARKAPVGVKAWTTAAVAFMARDDSANAQNSAGTTGTGGSAGARRREPPVGAEAVRASSASDVRPELTLVNRAPAAGAHDACIPEEE
jgi:hypothetical protein